MLCSNGLMGQISTMQSASVSNMILIIQFGANFLTIFPRQYDGNNSNPRNSLSINPYLGQIRETLP